MKRKVWIIPHTHYDAEVFLVKSETLEIGYANLLGALAGRLSPRMVWVSLAAPCLSRKDQPICKQSSLPYHPFFAVR